MLGTKSIAPLVGRILLSAIFLVAGYHKILDQTSTVNTLTSHGFPYPSYLAMAATAGEIIGGLMLLVGFWTRFAGIAFFIYSGVLAVVIHNFWTMEAAQQGLQMTIFYFHLALMGGMAYLATFGAGPISIDRR